MGLIALIVKSLLSAVDIALSSSVIVSYLFLRRFLMGFMHNSDLNCGISEKLVGELFF
jgi:hypothetical protein